MAGEYDCGWIGGSTGGSVGVYGVVGKDLGGWESVRDVRGRSGDGAAGGAHDRRKRVGVG